MHSHLFVLLVFLLSVVLCGEWVTRKTEKELHTDGFVNLDFATNADTIEWKVSCKFPCQVYLMNNENLQRMTQNLSFYFLYHKSNISVDTGSWSDKKDIKQRLIIVGINRYPHVNIVSIEIRQFIPEQDGFWEIAVVIACLLMVIIAICIVIYFYARWRRKRLQYSRMYDETDGDGNAWSNENSNSTAEQNSLEGNQITITS